MFRLPRLVEFRVTLIVLNLALIVVVTLSTVSLIIGVSTETADETATSLFEAGAVSAHATISSFLTEVAGTVTAASAIDAFATPPSDSGIDHPGSSFFESSLAAFPNLYSIYVGYADGGFLQMIDIAGDARVAETLGAPVGARFALRAITVTGETRTEHWTYLDGSHNIVGTLTSADPAYDPRERGTIKLGG